MRKKLFNYLSLLVCLSMVNAYAQSEEKIEALKSPFYVGKSVMACGILNQVTHLNKVHYLNLDYPYPAQTLTIVIWDEDYPDFEARFGDLAALEGRRVCARGKITEYKNYLQIVVKNHQFLRLMK